MYVVIYNTRLAAFLQDKLGKPIPGQTILLKQEMMGWQWHQLDRIQIICTLFQTDNHVSTSSLRLFTGQIVKAPKEAT